MSDKLKRKSEIRVLTPYEIDLISGGAATVGGTITVTTAAFNFQSFMFLMGGVSGELSAAALNDLIAAGWSVETLPTDDPNEIVVTAQPKDHVPVGNGDYVQYYSDGIDVLSRWAPAEGVWGYLGYGEYVDQGHVRWVPAGPATTVKTTTTESKSDVGFVGPTPNGSARDGASTTTVTTQVGGHFELVPDQ
jgi:hypothetical protein